MVASRGSWLERPVCGCVGCGWGHSNGRPGRAGQDRCAQRGVKKETVQGPNKRSANWEDPTASDPDDSDPKTSLLTGV